MNRSLQRSGTAPDGASPRRAPARPLHPIDPRFEDRRRRVARQRSRRRRRRLAAFLAVAIPVTGALVVERSPLMDVDRIVVGGGVRTADDVVVAVSGIEEGRPLRSISTDEVERRVERLAWVADASVRRDFPGTVRIDIIERSHVAVAGAGASRMLIDPSGRVLGSAGRTEGLPSLGDLRPDDLPGTLLRPSQRTLAGVAASIPADMAGEIAELRDGELGIEAARIDGLVIVLGDPGHIRSKFDSVEAVLAHEEPGALARIDVSVPSVPALTRSSHGAQ